MHANRLEDWGDHPADGSQRRVVDVIDDFPAQREAVESTQENADDDNHFTSTQNEAFQTLPGLDNQAFNVWYMVDRQLHDKRRRFTAHDGVLEHQASQHRHHDTQHIQREDRQRTVLPEEGSREYCEDSQTRAAGHKRCHHDGHQTFTRCIKRTCTHYRRYVTTETDDQRHKGFPRQAQRLHQTVHHKRRTRHIAGVLKEGEEQVHHADLRHQWQHGVNTTAQALGEEDSQPVREVERVANPLNTMHKECYGADVKQRL